MAWVYKNYVYELLLVLGESACGTYLEVVSWGDCHCGAELQYDRYVHVYMYNYSLCIPFCNLHTYVHWKLMWPCLLMVVTAEKALMFLHVYSLAHSVVNNVSNVSRLRREGSSIDPLLLLLLLMLSFRHVSLRKECGVHFCCLQPCMCKCWGGVIYCAYCMYTYMRVNRWILASVLLAWN